MWNKRRKSVNLSGKYFKRLWSASSINSGNHHLTIVKPNKNKNNGNKITVKKVNPYIERIKLPQVTHPLENVPEFLRFDMNSKSTKSSLPVISCSDENELINSTTLSAFFWKVFQNDSVGSLSVRKYFDSSNPSFTELIC